MVDGRFVYLDHQATTPLDPRVLEAMRPFLEGVYGNPSSKHAFGCKAAAAVEEARAHVAALINAQPEEIVFTSSATEANNLALLGSLLARSETCGRIVSTPVEHPSVLAPLEFLRHKGYRVEFVRVDHEGRVDIEHLRDLMTDDTVLVSTMAANNEIATVMPLHEISEIVANSNALWHVDASQYVGRLPLDVARLEVDFLSFSAHKFYGPKGAGALYIKRGLRSLMQPILWGGGQESGLRSGTTNVPAVVGFGEAARIWRLEGVSEIGRLEVKRKQLWEGLSQRLTDIVMVGSREHRLPGCMAVAIPGADADVLIPALPDVAISAGSACSSGALGPSHVLKAIGLDYDLAASTVRLSVGRFTAEDDIQYAISRLVSAIEKIREYSYG